MDTFLSILTFPMNIISAIAGLFKAQSYLAFFSNNTWAYVLCSGSSGFSVGNPCQELAG